MTKIPELGTLEKVDLREAWHDEALSFTPWLSQNLDALGDVIGIPLEFEGKEVAVDTFSADILARNPHDDSLILIENQLETTDHRHLGQIMTYLAGLETRTVIWVAADFREAHLSAVRWLNDHTVDPFAFFAVKVRVVRIGDSAPAPVFEVLVRPNQWERHLQELAQETRSLSEIGQFRRDFWRYYLDRYPEEVKFGKAGADSNRWQLVPQMNLVISSYIAKLDVGIFIRGRKGASGQETYEILEPHEGYLTDALRAELGSQDGDHFFVQSYKADTSDRSTWDELAAWLFGKKEQYMSVLQNLAEHNDE